MDLNQETGKMVFVLLELMFNNLAAYTAHFALTVGGIPVEILLGACAIVVARVRLLLIPKSGY